MKEKDIISKHRIIVFLIDDQLIICEAVKRMFESENDIEFHYCSDPTMAISIANEIKPTVILQDLVMPDIDGLTLVKLIRANLETKEVPLIVLSSNEEPKMKADAFALGANDYLVKIPDKLELIARIRYHSRGYINLLERNEALLGLEKANKFIRKTFGQYLSDDIVDSILASPEGTALGGEKRIVTILMTDLRGFSELSENLPPEDVVKIINIYLETMTEIIFKYEGTIDEIIGDAIFVLFGAPITKDDDAKRAVCAAIEMQKSMENVNQRCKKLGYPEIFQGIGLNTGNIILGNIGSTKRMKYGCVGQNVNITARIESYTIGGQILISESTLTACEDILRIDDHFTITPKGLKRSLKIYEVGGIGGVYNNFLPYKKKEELIELKKSISIKISVLDDKYILDDVYDGKLVKLSENAAQIIADITLNKFTNLKLTLFDNSKKIVTSDLYAKVINIESDNNFFVKFTSISTSCKEFINNLITNL